MPDPTPAQKKPLGVVLAGGASRRMGSDKAHLQHHGRSLLAHSAACLSANGLDVLVVGRPRPDDWPFADTIFRSDDEPGRGPLAGLITALRHAAGRAVLVVPCDVPHLDQAALRWLLDTWRSAEGSTLATQHDGRIEPLFAVYGGETLSVAERLLAENRTSLITLITTVCARLVTLPEVHTAAVADVDTPADWLRLDPRKPS